MSESSRQTIDESVPEQGSAQEPVAQQGQTPDAAAPGAAPASAAQPASGHEHAADGAAELQGDLDELGKLAAKRDEYLALAQRTQADFENYRKRVARESALAQERGVAKLAKELLPAIDNLDRAIVEIALAGGETGKDPLLGGVRLVRSELTAALARVGVESFSPARRDVRPLVARGDGHRAPAARGRCAQR